MTQRQKADYSGGLQGLWEAGNEELAGNWIHVEGRCKTNDSNGHSSDGYTPVYLM